jgi:D-mannonate dehydratase
MPTPDNPSYSPWITSTNYGKSYRLRFVDYGEMSPLDLVLEVHGLNTVVIHNIPRENSIRYQMHKYDEYIEQEVRSHLTSL